MCDTRNRLGMASRIFANVAPAVLAWARESAGLSIDVAARKLAVTSDKVEAWERGEERPSVAQLRKAGVVYKRPLATFFLSEPPESVAPIHDFRRLAGPERLARSPEFLIELRRARRRRLIAVEIATEAEESVPDVSLRATTADDPDTLAQAARQWLGVSVAQQSEWRGDYGPLSGWVSLVESRAVLVFQTGHVDIDEMRGFSISEYPLPAIVLNATDAPRARAFTLAHELVHLFLRNGGVCDPARVPDGGQTDDERVEVFCNRVAGALMVPTADLLNDPAIRSVGGGPRAWDESVLRRLADRFAVSREVVLRRLLILGRTTQAFYEGKRDEYRQAFLAQRREAKEAGTGFAPYPRVVVRDLGKRYTRTVLDAYEREQITSADVADYLGVRLKHLADISEAAQSSGGDV
jgi:Zn-dependent peptidase ImmA (M78 family)/transcriptional regulator with XRE-family HTH domain